MSSGNDGNVDEIGWYGNNSGRLRTDADEIWRTDQANYSKRITENGCQTHPVGQKRANGFGLYDLQGNVWEWCMDWYSEKYYENSPSTDPIGGSTGSVRVNRGGGWFSRVQFLRSAVRRGDAPAAGGDDLGFR